MKKAIAIILSFMLVLAITFPTAAISSIAVKSIKLDSSKIILKIGETASLKVTLTPANTSQKKLTYVSSSKNVATVSSTGVIKGIHAGNTAITVYTPNNKIFAICNVIISSKNFKGQIVVSLCEPNGYADAWKLVAEEYKKLQPKVNVLIEAKPQEGYADWLKAQLNSGNVRPDLVNVSLVGADKGNWIDWIDYLNTPNQYENGTIWSDMLPEKTQVGFFQNKLVSLTTESCKSAIVYNKDIFKKVGVKVPKTWDEFVSVCDKLQKAGYIPLSLSGDNASFWYGQFANMEIVYTDQYQRDKINLFVPKEGDSDYDPAKDGVFKLDYNNPFSDYSNAFNKKGQRAMKAIEDKTWRFDGADISEMYQNLKKVFPKYVLPGWTGIDGTGSVGYFMREEAAMMIDGSWRIISFNLDQKDLAKYDTLDDKRKGELKGWKKFNLGAMNFPSMTGKYVKSPARSYEITTGGFGAVKKNKEHDEMIVDFTKFYLSTKGYSIFYNGVYDTGNYTLGAPLLKNVKFKTEIDAFAQIPANGNANSEPTWYTRQGYGWVSESIRDYTDYTIQYFNNKIAIDEFLTKHQKNFEMYFDKALESLKMVKEDLDHPERPLKSLSKE